MTLGLKSQIESLLNHLLNKPNITEKETDEILSEIGDLLSYEDRVYDYFYTKMQSNPRQYTAHELVNNIVEVSSYLANKHTTSYL